MDDNKKVPEILASDVEKIGQKIFFGLTALIVLLVPLIISKQFFFPFIVPRTVFFMIMVDVSVIVWAVLHFLNPKQYRIAWKNPIVIATGALLTVWTAAGAFGADWVLSFWSTYQRMTGILLLLHLVMWVLVTTAVLRKEQHWNKLLAVFSFTGVFVSAYTMFGPHGFAIFKNLDLSRGGATIGNTSFLGTYVLFTLFATLILLSKRKAFGKKSKIWLWLSMAVMVFSPALFNFKIFFGQIPLADILANPLLMLGQARAVAGAVAIGLIMAFGLYWMQKKAIWKKATGLLISGGLAIGVMAIMVMMFVPTSKVHQEFGEMTSWARYLIWDEAIEAFNERPLLGWGPETFDLIHQSKFDSRLYIRKYGGELWFDRAHNVVIDTMVNTGILGVMAYGGLFIAFFLIVYRLRKKGRISNAEAAILGGLMFAYLVQGLTVFDMTVSYVALFFMFSYVASKLPRTKDCDCEKIIGNDLAWKGLHGLIVVAALVLIFSTSTRILNSAGSISQSLTVGSAQDRMDLYQQGFALPAGRTLFLRTISTRMYDTLRESPEYLTPDSTPIILSEATFFEDALIYEAEARPFNYRAYVAAGRMAQLRGFLGEPEKVNDAIAYNLKAIEIAPQNPMAHLNISELYAMLGNYDAAEASLRDMLAAAPDSVFLQDTFIQSLSTVNSLREGVIPQR